jgi:hypothetical protein
VATSPRAIDPSRFSPLLITWQLVPVGEAVLYAPLPTGSWLVPPATTATTSPTSPLPAPARATDARPLGFPALLQWPVSGGDAPDPTPSPHQPCRPLEMETTITPRPHHLQLLTCTHHHPPYLNHNTHPTNQNPPT